MQINIPIGPLDTEQTERFPASFARVQELLSSKLTTGSYSFGFALELTYDFVISQQYLFQVLDEISGLESGIPHIGTKAPIPFKHPPLRGLYHKHFFTPAFMGVNLLNEMKRQNTVGNLLAPHVGKVFDEAIAKSLCRELVVGNFEKRSQRGALTGEWIIFDQINGANYYLTLSTHNELDYQAFERIQRYRQVDCELRGAA
ncbi:hypothetical protein [Acidocella sp.]|uniref:hypothetical protein n=1 Tax=Acidocella sp. TaxID=50710 RepID=UPI00260FA97D|nr:hypothetical protein [Acidocella sp.]